MVKIAIGGMQGKEWRSWMKLSANAEALREDEGLGLVPFGRRSHHRHDRERGGTRL